MKFNLADVAEAMMLQGKVSEKDIADTIIYLAIACRSSKTIKKVFTEIKTMHDYEES